MTTHKDNASWNVSADDFAAADRIQKAAKRAWPLWAEYANIRNADQAQYAGAYASCAMFEIDAYDGRVESHEIPIHFFLGGLFTVARVEKVRADRETAAATARKRAAADREFLIRRDKKQKDAADREALAALIAANPELARDLLNNQ